MKHINIYYIAIIGIGLLLWNIDSQHGGEIASFYGFAENKETEINFNYPVVVGGIKVRPGEFVKQGTPLIDLYRIKAKEVMADESYKIADLRAKETIWKTEMENDLKQLGLKKKLEVDKITTDIQKLKEQIAFDQSLYKDLKTVQTSEKKYAPLSSKIEALERELVLVESSYANQVKAIEVELSVGKNPYAIAVERLQAEQQFSEATKKQFSQITAPTDGVIGNIHCKEAEHIPSYKTLVTFYEPNPTLVKGFVQEDLLLHVSLQDTFLIRSTKNPEMNCKGEVIGLGSRIVEIPERLRKVAGMKTYGREVLVAIPPDNQFLQKEKVILEFMNDLKVNTSASRTSKSLVDLEKGVVK